MLPLLYSCYLDPDQPTSAKQKARHRKHKYTKSNVMYKLIFIAKIEYSGIAATLRLLDGMKTSSATEFVRLDRFQPIRLRLLRFRPIRERLGLIGVGAVAEWREAARWKARVVTPPP